MITELIPIQETIEDKLYQEIQSLRESLDKYRKAQFAQIGALKKEVVDIKQEHENWKAMVCK